MPRPHKYPPELRERARPHGVRDAGATGERCGALAGPHLQRPGDDIDNPYGRGDTTFAACAERLDGLVTTVVAALARVLARPGRG